MKPHFLMLAFVFSSLILVQPATAQRNDTERDILVTFDNQGARMHSTGMSAPYRNRKRYSIAATARRSADEVRDEYALLEVDHWPIRSLSVYCFVYRVPSGEDRETVIDRLKSDARIESVQALQEFETGTSANGKTACYDVGGGITCFQRQGGGFYDLTLAVDLPVPTMPAEGLALLGFGILAGAFSAVHRSPPARPRSGSNAVRGP